MCQVIGPIAVVVAAEPFRNILVHSERIDGDSHKTVRVASIAGNAGGDSAP